MWPWSEIRRLKAELAISRQLLQFMEDWTRELLSKLDTAEANDARDPETGRYVKREHH